MKFKEREALLADFETAARIYCAKAALDPDMKIQLPPEKGKLLMVQGGKVANSQFILNWQMVAEDLIDLSMKLSAMREAKELAVADKNKIN